MQPLSSALRRVMPQHRVIPLAEDPAGIEKFLLERPLLPATAYAAELRVERDELTSLRGHNERSLKQIAIERLEAQLELAETRQRLLQDRPPGCFCYGLGGMQRRGIALADGEAFASWRVWCICPEAQQQQAERDRIVAERARQIMQKRADALFGSLPLRFQPWTFASLIERSEPHRSTAALVQEWVEDTTRWALVLRGPNSTGKTGLGVSALKHATEKGRSALYVDTTQMLLRLRSSFESIEDKVDRAESLSADQQWTVLHGVDVLLIDDLGAEYHRANGGPGTDWVTEQIWSLIATRHANRQKTITTSNHSLNELRDLFRHARITARLAEESLVINTADLPPIREPGRPTRGGNTRGRD